MGNRLRKARSTTRTSKGQNTNQGSVLTHSPGRYLAAGVALPLGQLPVAAVVGVIDTGLGVAGAGGDDLLGLARHPRRRAAAENERGGIGQDAL